MNAPGPTPLLSECVAEIRRLGAALEAGDRRSARTAVTVLRRLLDVADAHARRLGAEGAEAPCREGGLRLIRGGRP